MASRVAWFVCRYRNITDDIAVSLIDGAEVAETVIIKRGRMMAARRFKRLHELHPCVRVDVEFQAVMPVTEYHAT